MCTHMQCVTHDMNVVREITSTCCTLGRDFTSVFRKSDFLDSLTNISSVPTRKPDSDEPFIRLSGPCETYGCLTHVYFSYIFFSTNWNFVTSGAGINIKPIRFKFSGDILNDFSFKSSFKFLSCDY